MKLSLLTEAAGAAVGILVTVLLAALAAVVLVVVRNKAWKRETTSSSISSPSRYSNIHTDSSVSLEAEECCGEPGRGVSVLR